MRMVMAYVFVLRIQRRWKERERDSAQTHDAAKFEQTDQSNTLFPFRYLQQTVEPFHDILL